MNGCGLAMIALAALVSGTARAADPDAAAIARVTGLQPDVKNGVAKVSVPRTDGLEVTALHYHFMFLHYWGKGPADDLARGIEAARATQPR